MPEDHDPAGSPLDLGDSMVGMSPTRPKRRTGDMVNIAESVKKALTDDEDDEDNDNKSITNDGAMAVEMWYWNTRNEFKSEVMFCNPVDSDTPKLIIPLEVFDKMKKVYNEKSRLLVSRKEQFDEMMTLFRVMRRQYYHDLQGLRDLLKTAREAQELRENGGYLDPRKQARLARMDTVVRNREVHYFNVLDVVDPEFKDILISECRQFHKELILEIKNAALADQLAALGIGTLTLEEKLRMLFIAEFELSEIITQLAKFQPTETAPPALRRRYLLSLFGAAGIEEVHADEIIARYIDKVAGAEAAKDPTDSEEYKALKEKFDEVDEKKNDLAMEVEELKARLADEQDMKEAEMNDLKAECDRLRTEATNASMNASGASAAEIDALKADLAAAKGELADAKEEAAAKESEARELNAKILATPRVEDLSGPLAEAEEKIRTLSDELDEYRSGARVSATVSAANEEQLRKQLDEAREQARQDAENAMSEKLELSKLMRSDSMRQAEELAAAKAAEAAAAGQGKADPEWVNIKQKHVEASEAWVDELVEGRSRAESQISTLTKDLDFYKTEYDKINEEAGNMTAEMERMKSDMQTTAAALAVQHPTKASDSDDGGKAAREAMARNQSSSEEEKERQANEIDRGDLVQLRVGFEDKTEGEIAAGIYGVVKKRYDIGKLAVRFAHPPNCPLIAPVLGKSLRLKARRGTFLGIPGAPENFAELAMEDADEVAEELGLPLSPRSARGSKILPEMLEDGTAMTPKPPSRERKLTKTKTQPGFVEPGKKIVEVTEADYDAQTGRTVGSYRQEAEEMRRASIKNQSLADKLKAEMASLKQSREEISEKFAALQKAHENLLHDQERAFDEDLTEKCENDVYVFCLWLMRRFLTIREGFAALDENGQGSITLGELVDGLEKNKFIHFFAKRVFRKLDVDGSGDIEIKEVIDLKEQWALVENERSSVSKAEVDAMKEGWAKKEEMLRRYYEDAKRKAVDLESIVKEWKDKSRGGRDKGVSSQELQRVEEEAKKVQDGLEKKVAYLESQLAEVNEGYKSMEDKCGKSIWQNRQDLVEMQKLKREKAEVEVDMAKLQKKYDALKRAREANQFIDDIMKEGNTEVGAGANPFLEQMGGVHPGQGTAAGRGAPQVDAAGNIIVGPPQMPPDSHLLDPTAQAFGEFIQGLQEESGGIRDASSASLFQKLQGKDIPYRIRNEAISGAKKRWQLLYADAAHRKRTSKAQGNFASLSPRSKGPRVTSPPPLVHELRDAMAGSPHASWSYNFRQFASPNRPELFNAPHRSTNDAPPFSPSRVVSMAGFLQTGDHLQHHGGNLASKTHHAGFLPKSTRRALNLKRQQQHSLSPRDGSMGRGQHGATPPQSPFSQFQSMMLNASGAGNASRRYLIRTPPQQQNPSAGTSQNNWMPLSGGASAGAAGGEAGGLPAEFLLQPGGYNNYEPQSSQPNVMNTTSLHFPLPPSVVSIAPAPSARTPSVHALSPRRSPSPRPRAGEQPELSDQTAAALLKNLGGASPRRRREGALQISYEDPMDLYVVANAYERSRSHSRVEGKSFGEFDSQLAMMASASSARTPPGGASMMSPRGGGSSLTSSPRTRKNTKPSPREQTISMASISEGKVGPVSRINLSAVEVMNQAPVLNNAVSGNKLGGGLPRRSSPSPPASVAANSVEIFASQSGSYAHHPPVSTYNVSVGGGAGAAVQHQPSGDKDSQHSFIVPTGGNKATSSTSKKVGTTGGGTLHQGRPGGGDHAGKHGKNGSRSRSLSLEFPRVDSRQLVSPAKKFSGAPREVASSAVRSGMSQQQLQQQLVPMRGASSGNRSQSPVGPPAPPRDRSHSPARTATGSAGGGVVPPNAAPSRGRTGGPNPQLSTVSMKFEHHVGGHPGGVRQFSPHQFPNAGGNNGLNNSTTPLGGGSYNPGKVGQLSANILMKNTTPDFGGGVGAPGGGYQPQLSVANFETEMLPEASATSNSFFASPAKKLGGNYVTSAPNNGLVAGAGGGPGAAPGSLHKSPSLYKVPGGRYIPKKELPTQLNSIEINTTSLSGAPDPNLQHHASTQSLVGANGKALPWDPKDPPGKNALPVSFGAQKKSETKSPAKKKSANAPSMPQLSPFKSVDQWVHDTK